MQLKMKTIVTLLCCLAISFSISAQETTKKLTQTIRGIITDRASGAPLPFVSVGLLDIPEIGASTDDNGQFVLTNVPLGRHSLQATSVGYESSIYREILVTSAKEVYLEIPLKENVQTLNEVVVHVQTNKDEPLNKMATTGARMLSVEEASRYAGGMDDPARLVSSFAGVSANIGNNGISVHGNAPSLLQWKLEDIEIPNPNHFADINSLGGGLLSSLSNNVLGNSDFFTGAFPAEYGNAISGVFDMKLRNGNNRKFEHTFQAGILGIDFASEGPLSKKHNSSYIFNYRYSTTGLLSNLGMDLDGKMAYQDLNFKMNFPTKKAGIFSIWGTALIDDFKGEFEEDPNEWEYLDDSGKSRAKQHNAAGGITHRYFFNNEGLLKTTLAATYSKHDAEEERYNEETSTHTPYGDLKSKYTNLVLNTSFNKKYSSKHTNKTGITYTKMYYDMDLKKAPLLHHPLEQISVGNGNTDLITAYTSSSFSLNDKVTFNLGINGQYLTLNDKYTIEPRVGIKWQSSSKSSFAIAYGLHSRMEKMDVYYVKTPGKGNDLSNKDLDFTKAHHVMLSYNYKISDDMNLRFEPYFQYLYDVPVIADSSYSVLNRNNFYVEEALVNKGKGRNFGIDVTLEKYLTNGLYYMVTGSIFSSKYSGGDGVWHDTKFNRNFIVNGLIGKEWMIGRNKQNILSANIRLTVQGGNRYTPVLEEESMNHPDLEIQYDESKPYSEQLSTMFIANYTISYKINKKNVSHEFAIKGLNATAAKDYHGHEYSLKTRKIEPKQTSISLPNISYKIQF